VPPAGTPCLGSCYYGQMQGASGSEESGVYVQRLRTPPLPCVAPPRVFDAFGWCESEELEWRRPTARWDAAARIDSPAARTVFVMRRPCELLPSELARLHASGLGLETEEALAPWAIDDATDQLYAHRLRPGDFFWLAADDLNALFWGLHDWAHFHNHGPFEARAWTELQCDVCALAWLWINRNAVDLTGPVWERTRHDAAALSRARFAAEGLALESRLLSADSVRALAEESQASYVVKSPERKGAIGFDGDDGLVAAYRGAQAHAKTRAPYDCER
jgi:hypothetical protein